MLVITKSDSSTNSIAIIAIRYPLPSNLCGIRHPRTISTMPSKENRNENDIRKASRRLNCHKQNNKAVFNTITPQFTSILKLEYFESNNPRSTLIIRAKPPNIRIAFFITNYF